MPPCSRYPSDQDDPGGSGHGWLSDVRRPWRHVSSECNWHGCQLPCRSPCWAAREPLRERDPRWKCASAIRTLFPYFSIPVRRASTYSTRRSIRGLVRESLSPRNPRTSPIREVTDSPASWPTQSSRSGPLRHRMPVSFADVEQAFCIASKPTCPASGGIPGFEQSGAYGILGIGTQSSGGGIVNPILGMPGSLGKKWSLHLAGASGTLTLGAKLYGAGSAATIPMRQIGSSAGSALWADSRLPLCLSVGQTNACVPGLFDSGTYTMQVSGSVLGQAPTITGTDHVVAGTPVSVTLSGASAPFWTFTAGTTKSADLVTVKTGRRTIRQYRCAGIL